jgi:uncharacterized Tic20 family protein
MTDAPQPAASQARTWEMLCHLTALAGFFIPFGNLLGPLIVWLVKKNEIPSVDAHGKESLNFQISILIYAIVSGILVLVLIGFVLLIAVGIFSLVCIIIASIKVSNGEPYRYPLTIRFLQ